jgi:hypothetical protein
VLLLRTTPRRSLHKTLTTAVWATLAVFAIVETGLGCALGDSNGGGGGGMPCAQGHDEQCDDGNACHAGQCSADGLCVFKHLSTAPDDVGNCMRTDCVNDEPHPVVDDSDFEDDNNPCTQDTCDNGTPVHAPLSDGTGCDFEGHHGICQANECQVPCQGGSDCATTDACITGECVAATGHCHFENLDGVPQPGDLPNGDCQALVCVGGASQSVDDPTDLPDAPDCYAPLCTPDESGALAPDKEPRPEGAHCSVGVCDHDDHCVECLHDADCPQPQDLCLAPHCDAQHTCVSSTRPDGSWCGVCDACTSGTCGPAADNKQHPMQCDDGHGDCGAMGVKCACDGQGACKVKSGDTCGSNTDCASGVCKGNGKCM